MQFDVVVDDVPRMRLSAVVRAGLAGFPARRSAVDVVGVVHAAISLSLGALDGSHDVNHSHSQRSRSFAVCRHCLFRIMSRLRFMRRIDL